MKFFLIGFMGSGKTRVGKFAAKKNGLDFIDLDQYIEEKEGKSVRSIFDEKGEEHFRELEKMALEDVCSMDGDLLISCGGGTPCFYDNMDLMNANGTTVYMDLSSSRLAQRLKHSKSKRPLIASLKGDLQVFVHNKLMERSEHYQKAKIIVPQDRSNEKGISELISELMNAKD